MDPAKKSMLMDALCGPPWKRVSVTDSMAPKKRLGIRFALILSFGDSKTLPHHGCDRHWGGIGGPAAPRKPSHCRADVSVAPGHLQPGCSVGCSPPAVLQRIEGIALSARRRLMVHARASYGRLPNLPSRPRALRFPGDKEPGPHRRMSSAGRRHCRHPSTDGRHVVGKCRRLPDLQARIGERGLCQELRPRLRLRLWGCRPPSRRRRFAPCNAHPSVFDNHSTAGQGARHPETHSCRLPQRPFKKRASQPSWQQSLGPGMHR
jgi:hypothetical protein